MVTRGHRSAVKVSCGRQLSYGQASLSAASTGYCKVGVRSGQSRFRVVQSKAPCPTRVLNRKEGPAKGARGVKVVSSRRKLVPIIIPSHRATPPGVSVQWSPLRRSDRGFPPSRPSAQCLMRGTHRSTSCGGSVHQDQTRMANSLLSRRKPTACDNFPHPSSRRGHATLGPFSNDLCGPALIPPMLTQP